MLILTINEIPGGRILKTFGLVSGTCVRSRNIIGNVMGGVAALFGGKQSGYTDMVRQSREDATNSMVLNAQALSKQGANAIIGVRFDSGEFSGGQGSSMNEVFAYGTAVRYELVNPIKPE